MMKSNQSWLARVAFLPFLACLSGGPAHADDFSAWAHSADFRLDATGKGAALAADVVDFPVLLRLDSALFPFPQALPDGADIRFADPAGRALPYEIERWDAAGRRAEVWIRIPRIVAGTDSGYFRMHWGKVDAASAGNPGAVFDPAGGFAGAWHLQGEGILDATGSLAAGDGSRSTGTEGVIAGGRALRGINQGLVIPPGSAPVAASGVTVSLWVHAESWQGGSRRLFQKGTEPQCALAQEGDSLAWTVAGTTVKSLLPALGAWHQIVATHDGTVGRIYMDGNLFASRNAAVPIPVAAAEVGLGCRPSQGKPHNAIEGRLDEVSLGLIARSPDWVKLAFANQRAQQVLVRPPALVACPERFEVPRDTTISEGGTIALAGIAECATAFSWSAVLGPAPRILDPEVKLLQVAAPRITHDTSIIFRFTARFGDAERIRDVKVSIREAIPDPVFSLPAIAAWDGRDTLVLAPAIANLAAVRASRDSVIRYAWTIGGVSADTALRPESLVLRNASESGTLEVGLCLDNGGPAFCRNLSIPVHLPVSILALPVAKAPEARAPAWDALGRFRAGEAASGGRP